MTLSISNAPPNTPKAFKFFCHELAENTNHSLARISLDHPRAGSCLQDPTQRTPGDLDDAATYLLISSNGLDSNLGALNPHGSSLQIPRIHQATLTLKLSVDFCLGGSNPEGGNFSYYLPSWIEPFIEILGESSAPGSLPEGLQTDIQRFAVEKLPVAERIHLVPIKLLPTFRVPPPGLLSLGHEEVARKQLLGQPIREGSLVVVRILRQPFVFQVTHVSATVADYFQAGISTAVTFSLNHFDFTHGSGTIYKPQLQQVVSLIDWTFRAESKGGIGCTATLVSGPAGIGKSTFLKSVVAVFRCSRAERVGVLELDANQLMLEARKSDDAASHFAKKFDYHSVIQSGTHSAHLFVIYGLHVCAEGELKEALLLALSRALSSLKDPHHVLLECPGKVPRALDFLRSHCILLDPPSRAQRKELLLHFLAHPISPTALDILTQSTHTYTPEDLKYLATAALSFHQCAPRDLTELMASLSLEPSAIDDRAAEYAIEETARQRKPGVVSSPPSVSFDQIGGYSKTKSRLNQILILLSQEGQSHRLGLKRPSGLLLVGPSGCGKTRLAQAFASHTHRSFGHHFLSVKGPSLFSQYFGGTEEAVRNLFKTARSLAPCTLFLDEIDALGPKRGWNSQDDGAGGVSARVLSTLLNELDGAQAKAQVFVVACTSFPHLLDDALIRPGRFDTTILVDLPTPEDRLQILSSLIANDFASISFDLSPSDLASLVGRTDGFTPADLAWILREAALAALEDPLPQCRVTLDLVLRMLKGRRPSVHRKDLAVFEKYRAAQVTSP